MVIVLRTEAMMVGATETDSKGIHAGTLERLENYLDGQQRFQSLAELVFSRYNATFAPKKKYASLLLVDVMEYFD